jgi:hypothetical protein
MARLYHKAYRRGGSGRRGGYKPASPDTVTAATFPGGLGVPTTAQPAYLDTVADPYNTVMTVRRISTTGGDFPASSGSYFSHEYAKRQPESGRYVGIRVPSAPHRIVDRLNGYAYVDTMFNASYGSRLYPGRFYGEQNSGTDFGYNDEYYNGGGTTIVFDGGATYSSVSFGLGEGSLPVDEDYVALLCRRSSDNVYEVKCVRMSDGAVQGTWVTGVTSTGNFDNMCMSARGTYVCVQLTGTVDGRTAGLHVFDRTMTHQRQISIGGGGAHLEYGLLEDGLTEVVVTVSASDRAVEYYTLSDGVKTTVIAGASSPFGFNTHVSTRCHERPGYVYISHFDDSWVSHTTAANGSVCAVRLATGEIELWGSVQMHETNASNYHQQAWGCPSWDGKRVYFNSSWRDDSSGTPGLLYVIERTG